jgi:glucosamine 6-phosphate synthetase-like amidotransferase/phosphosugar isomerase protein
LREELLNKDRAYFNTTSDLEIILNIFALEMQKRFDNDADIFENICESVESVFNRCRGAYSVCGIVAGKGMVIFRDPHGIRPLVCGLRQNEDGTRDYILLQKILCFILWDLNTKAMFNLVKSYLSICKVKCIAENSAMKFLRLTFLNIFIWLVQIP